MAAWAATQGIPQIKLLTDQSNRVTMQAIREAVSDIQNVGGVEQLIVYFSGHGVYVRMSEYWLLSGAPDDRQEAINLDYCVDSARQSAFSNVVFLSDACRTLANDFQFSRLLGSDIFPNPLMPANPERDVDSFFAAGLGEPSIETRHAASLSGWRSLYTETLCEALEGRVTELLDLDASVGAGVKVVRCRPLGDYLTTEVPQRAIALSLGFQAVQRPAARITSRDTAWLACFGGESPAAPVSPDISLPENLTATSAEIDLAGLFKPFGTAYTGGGQFPPNRAPKGKQPESPFPIKRLDAAFREGFSLTSAHRYDAVDALEVSADIAGVAHDVAAADRIAPAGFETACGFHIVGAAFRSARVLGGAASLFDQNAEIVRVNTPLNVPANVLLTLTNGHGTVLPAIPSFIGNLVFEGEALVNVSYQNSYNKPEDLSDLRALVASLSRKGLFRLDAEEHGGAANALRLANRIRYGKSLDPSLALYAAYGFYDLQHSEQTAEMRSFLWNNLHFDFFDIALLSRSLTQTVSPGQIFPFFPLLTRGWALIHSSNPLLPPSLVDLYTNLANSQWSLFNPTGVSMITRAVEQNEVF